MFFQIENNFNREQNEQDYYEYRKIIFNKLNINPCPKTCDHFKLYNYWSNFLKLNGFNNPKKIYVNFSDINSNTYAFSAGYPYVNIWKKVKGKKEQSGKKSKKSKKN